MLQHWSKKSKLYRTNKAKIESHQKKTKKTSRAKHILRSAVWTCRDCNHLSNY